MTALNAAGQVRVCWKPTLDDTWVTITDHVSDVTFTRDRSAPAEIDLLPTKTQRFLVVPARLLEWSGPNTIRLRATLSWFGHRTLFGRTCPRSQRVKSEYRRRLRRRTARRRSR